MPFFEQDADPRDAPSDRPYDPNLVVRFLEEVEVDARAVQRSLLNLMEKMDLRPPSAAA